MTDQPKRWWRYAVVRGPMIPAEVDGKWFDLDDMQQIDGMTYFALKGAQMTPTDRWEQREDGAVAVVYEWTSGRG